MKTYRITFDNGKGESIDFDEFTNFDLVSVEAMQTVEALPVGGSYEGVEIEDGRRYTVVRES